jgi:hypothetical protein
VRRPFVCSLPESALDFRIRRIGTERSAILDTQGADRLAWQIRFIANWELPML